MKKVVGVVALVAVLANVGCTSVATFPAADIEQGDKVLEVTYRDGTVVKFQEVVEADTTTTSPRMRKSTPKAKRYYGVYQGEARTVDGLDWDGRTVSVPVDSLSTVRVRRADYPKSALLVVGIGAALFGILLAEIASDPPSFF